MNDELSFLLTTTTTKTNEKQLTLFTCGEWLSGLIYCSWNKNVARAILTRRSGKLATQLRGLRWLLGHQWTVNVDQHYISETNPPKSILKLALEQPCDCDKKAALQIVNYIFKTPVYCHCKYFNIKHKTTIVPKLYKILTIVPITA